MAKAGNQDKFSTTMPPALHERLKAESALTRIPKAQLISRAVEADLDRAEKERAKATTDRRATNTSAGANRRSATK